MPASAAIAAKLRQGIVSHRQGKLAEAARFYQEVLRHQPDNFDALHLLGIVACQTGRLVPGVELIAKATAINPNNAAAHSDLGNGLNELKRFAEALASFDKAIALQPDYADAYSNRGIALKGLKRLDEAVASYDKAIALQPHHAIAFVNRGNALKDLDRLDEALASYDRALALQPDYADAYYNRGDALRELGRIDEALVNYDRALALQPNHADARLNRAVHYLAIGNFPRGWDEYEWRWQSADWPSPKLNTSKPMWSGARSNNTLLIWAEQGIGDEILHGGILRSLEDFPQKKFVSIDKRLVPLFRRSLPNFEFLSKAEIGNHEFYDEQLPMGSLGRLFRTSIESFEAHKSPYLKTDRALADRIRAKIKSSGKIVCGLSWSSKNARIGAAKSLSLADLLPILSLENLEFVDLQYGDTSQERREMKAVHGVDIKKLEDIDNFNDIDGLAALIDACDLVITVSNTTAHLAGAVGKETLLILPTGTGKLWYWQNGNGVSLWYPSIRTFEQKERGVWNHPIDGIKRYLENHTVVRS